MLPTNKIHRTNAVRLILGRDMVFIWNEYLIHFVAKIREMGDNDELHKEDKRLFAYVWSSIAGQ